MTEPEEQPTIEEPTQPKKQEEQVDATAVLEELRKIGVEDPQQLTNMHRASQESGRLARLLGEERQRNEEMQRQMRELEYRSRRQPEQDPYSDTGESVDLSKVIRKEVFSSLGEFYNQKTRENQEMTIRQYKELQDIKSDKRYGIVRDKWENHLRDPDVLYRLQTGQTTPRDEYAEMVLSTLENTAIKSKQVIESYAGKNVAPHIESGNTQYTPRTPADEEKQEKIRKMTKPDRWRGTDDDIAKLLSTEMPSDDPFWNR